MKTVQITVLRKRRRQILEEEEDISEEDYKDALKKDKFMPDMAEFEEDDTGSLLTGFLWDINHLYT